MSIEYTKNEVIGGTRHDYGGYPKSIPKGSIIDRREYDHYEGSESKGAYLVVSDIADIMEYLIHEKPKSKIPANVGRSDKPKYAQWYMLDWSKLIASGLIEERKYFEF